MPDITMCLNEECDKKEKCYRFKSNPSYRQSYCMFNFKENNYGCFWEYIEKIIVLPSKEQNVQVNFKINSDKEDK